MMTRKIDSLVEQLTQLLIKRGEDTDQYQFFKLSDTDLRIVLNGQKYSISLNNVLDIDINSNEWKILKTEHVNKLTKMRKTQHPSAKINYQTKVLSKFNKNVIGVKGKIQFE